VTSTAANKQQDGDKHAEVLVGNGRLAPSQQKEEEEKGGDQR
jgi:hypothetical protein